MVKQRLWLTLILLHTVSSQSTNTKSDEDRPYKFGFNIQGYQHRQEEKDEKGLIKGEYGFITADGYYRVTVYATDENGDFKILSMKNYYVGFPPEDPTTTPQIPTTNNRQAVTPPVTKAPAAKERTYEPLTGRMGCSNCLIPSTTTTRRPSGYQGQNAGGIGGGQTGNNNGLPGIGLGTGSFAGPGQNSAGGQGSQAGPRPGHRNTGNSPVSTQGYYGSTGGSTGPKTTSPQGNQVHGGQGRPQIGEIRDGLPPGVTVDDIKGLLYRFNYTVGFHGHHELGYRNGDKEGNYFFDGRDGTERRVEYLANEFGYQPNITFVDLPENDERRPNELTEKQYGLKGYEFKWFYRR